MRKFLLALVILACAAWAANLKLYMKDGSYHIVREYEVLPDRVHFYSVERSEWEDVPLDLVDIKRTQSEAAARQTKLEEDSKAMAAEEKAERDLEKEKRRIPQDPGAYWLLGQEVQVMKLAESTVNTKKGREILKKLAPIPVITGKATLEIQGAHSLNVFADPEQEFYMQLSEARAVRDCQADGEGRGPHRGERDHGSGDQRGCGGADHGGHSEEGTGWRPVQDLAQGKAGARGVCAGGVYRRQAEHADLGFRY